MNEPSRHKGTESLILGKAGYVLLNSLCPVLHGVGNHKVRAEKIKTQQISTSASDDILKIST